MFLLLCCSLELLTTRLKIKISFIRCQCSSCEYLLLLVSLMLPVPLLHVAGYSPLDDFPTDSGGPAQGGRTQQDFSLAWLEAV
jgi:hypothetical protein